MNNFKRFLTQIESLKAGIPEAEFEISEPVESTGFWNWSLDLPDGYAVEVEWKNGRGFGLVAGTEFFMGEGVHEIYREPSEVVDRVTALVERREATTGDYPVSLAELRKLRGRQQQELAAQMGMTKSGLAQIEANAASGKLQLNTLHKLVNSLGGQLIISAAFPDGTERKVAIHG